MKVYDGIGRLRWDCMARYLCERLRDIKAKEYACE